VSLRRAGLALSAAVLTGCSAAPSGPQRAARVVLVSIDTLRWDHVGASRAGLPLTPSLDALAAAGVSFDDALANCTVTRSSHASMLTGLYPWRHGIPDNSGTLRPEATTAAEHLRDGGVTTAAVVSSFPMRELTRGFATFHQAFDGHDPNRANEPVGSPEATTKAALDWLRKHRAGPFFLFVHYFPPHGPYTAPERFRLPSLETPTGAELPVSRVNYEHGAIPAYQRLGENLDPGLYRARYAAHVRYADHHLGRLIGALREMGLYEDAAVIVTSDHGESLGERGWHFCHGNLTYREQSAVPLVVKLPGGARAGTRVAAPVQGVDLFPTVLELMGVPAPPGRDGRSLLAALDGEIPSDRVRFTQSGDAEQLSVVSGAWKFTRVAGKPRYLETGHPRRTLFRLDRDPAEAENLVDAEALVASRLEDAADRSFTGFGPSQPLDPATEERLRALGYVR